MRGATVDVKCACGCGTVFTARVADRKRGWGKYSSKSCKARTQEKRTHQHAIRTRNFNGSGVSRETYIYYKQEYGGDPQFDHHGEYVGFCGHDHEHDCNKD